MVRSSKTGMRPTGWIVDRVRMGGKKTVVAGVLILIMACMWIRVLVGQKPASVVAAPAPPWTLSATHAKPERVERVELPRSPGRHDSIRRDFFCLKDRACFQQNPVVQIPGTEREVLSASSESVQEVIRRVAQTLKLEAVSRSEGPQAFINDRLVRVGDKLIARDGGKSYEFEVLQIRVDSVLVQCCDIPLTLRLAQPLEVTK